jgi:uncharacterized protein YndB with AHSA1/START domain
MNTNHRTVVEADPNLPTVRIVRDFDAPPNRVFRAWVDPDLIAQWLGPKDTTMRIDAWEPRTGGGYRYAAERDGEEIAVFYGSFHEVRPASRLVQTFTYEGVPDGVSLDTTTFEEVEPGRTRVTVLSVVDTMEGRDAMIASGMESGVVEGYEKLDTLLER